MNPNDEIHAEFNRQRILTEIEHIRLEKIASQSHPQLTNRINLAMLTLANWMIATGKSLHKRYEIPSVTHCQPSSLSNHSTR